MQPDLRQLVDAHLGGFLLANGLRPAGEMADAHRHLEAKFYASDQLKLVFYRDARNGEINCLAGCPDAQNRLATDGSRIEGWFYVPELCPPARTGVDDLLRAAPATPRSDAEQMRHIASMLQDNFAALGAALKTVCR